MALGLASARRGRPGLASGLALGAMAWATSYAALVPAGLYEPPWTYDPPTLARDLGSHLVFGTAVAAVLRRLGAGAGGRACR